MRLGSGVIVDQLASDDYRYGGGSPIGSTVQQVVDLQGDGRDELLVFSSGNTARYVTVLSLVHGRIVAPRRNGRLAEFFFSGSTPPGSDPRQEPSGGGVNCEDVDGDGRRELTEYRPGGPGGRVLYRFAYRLDGSRLTRVAAHSTRGWPRFKVTSQGLDCAAPGRVADGHYAGDVIAVDRPGRRARFSVRCAPGEEQPPAPVTVDMSAARLHVDERRSRRPVSVGFEPS